MAVRPEALVPAPLFSTLLSERLHGSLRNVIFVATWKLQAYLAAIVMLALVGLVSFWIALAVMIAWALPAVVVYHWARTRGLLPDLLASKGEKAKAQTMKGACGELGLTVFKATLGGFQAYLYSRTACRLLKAREGQRGRSVLRAGIIGLGLAMFGVTATEHILGKAGYAGNDLLRMSLLGPFLNVPYKVMLSALVINTATRLAEYAFSVTSVISYL